MKKTDERYGLYSQILLYELLPAGGCTEPIAIAYTAAVARRELGCRPEHMDVYASGNLIKNAKAVYIPNGGNLRGVDAAAVLGALGGNAERALEVLLDMPEGMVEETRRLLSENYCTVHVLEGGEALQLVVRVQSGENTVEVELRHTHTNIVRIEKNGVCLKQTEDGALSSGAEPVDYGCLTVEGILDYANSFDISDEVGNRLRKQVEYNMRVAQEGLENHWGVNVGQMYYARGQHLQAYAAAGSDARMSGCNLPVMIVSGSGNQGITASLPVAVYAREHGIDEERMLRAVALSDLIAVHIKSGIGRLSAYCGAVCAATGSGCAITYLSGGGLKEIEDTLTNSLAVSSGMVCDGAKPSCAGKIAASLESAIMGHDLAMEGRAFQPGEGIVMDDVEETIDAVGCMASQGMQSTDRVILELMTK